jgi:hypothetical protein
MNERVWHSERFRKVSDRYPRRVAEAYGGDLDAAMAASDEQVAATVANWEKEHGLPVRDWPANRARRGAIVTVSARTVPTPVPTSALENVD